MLSLHFKSFKSRMLFIIMGTVLLSQAATFFLFDYIATQNAHYLIRQNLESTSRYFKDMTEKRFDLLKDNANLLVGDFAFKKALATHKQDTIKVALFNHQRRIDADLMIAFDAYGKFIALTSRLKEDEKALNNQDIENYFEHLIEYASYDNQEAMSAIIYWKNTAYQITVVPLKAPRVIAYIVIGHAVNDSQALKVKTISSSDMTFLVAPTTKPYPDSLKDAKIVGSTVEGFGKNDLKQLSEFTLKGDHISFDRENGTMIGEVVSIPQSNKKLAFYAVTQINLDDVLKNYTLYRPYVSILTLMLLCLSIPAAIIIARRITAPIEKLVRGAERIEKGDYSRKIYMSAKDEIGLLGERLNSMADGLAEREEMKFMAFHDSLTKLPNRRLFLQHLEDAVHAKKKAALMVIDLDGFKLINDKYGHDAGDEILRAVADRLRQFITNEDDVIARMGGDQFFILFHDLQKVRVISDKATSIIEMIEEPVHFGDLHLFVSASIGLNFSSKDMSTEEWMKGANLACGEAKRSGKRTFKFFNQFFDDQQ